MSPPLMFRKRKPWTVVWPNVSEAPAHQLAPLCCDFLLQHLHNGNNWLPCCLSASKEHQHQTSTFLSKWQVLHLPALVEGRSHCKDLGIGEATTNCRSCSCCSSSSIQPWNQWCEKTDAKIDCQQCNGNGEHSVCHLKKQDKFGRPLCLHVKIILV